MSGQATIGRPDVHVQIGVLRSEDATMPRRVEAEDLDRAIIDLEADLRALVQLGSVRSTIALVQHVERDAGGRRAQQKRQWLGANVAVGARRAQQRVLQRLFAVDGARRRRRMPCRDLVVDEEAGVVTVVPCHTHAALDDPRDARFSVEDGDLAGDAGAGAERIHVRQPGECAQRDLAADVTTQHIALGADPADAHRVPAGGGRNPRRPSTLCPSRLISRSRYAWARAACLAPATMATGYSTGR